MKRRTKMAPGIYRDAYGFSVMAAVGSGAKLIKSPEIRYPPETSLDVLKSRWLREKARLSDEYVRNGGQTLRGTLAADVEEYFKTAHLSAQRTQERRQQLAWWVARFGTQARGTLEPKALRQALNALRHPKTGDPASASTKNKYRTALSNLFTVLDGPNAINPVREVPKDVEPDAERRDQPYEFIQVLLAKMGDHGRHGKGVSRTKAYFSVRAYAPVTQAQLKTLKRTDVHWDTSEISTPGRKKGQGTRPRRKPLSPAGLAAFRLYDAADCWGRTPSRSSMRRIFIAARDAAVKELRQTQPEIDWSAAAEMLPKDLRHSFATLAYQQTGSLSVTQELLDHADKTTTLRYAQGALPTHLKAAGEAIARALDGIPPYVPPAVLEPPPRVRRKGRVIDFQTLPNTSKHEAGTLAHDSPSGGGCSRGENFQTKLPNTSLELSGNIQKKSDYSKHDPDGRQGRSKHETK